jgi:hypothetical protein
LGVSLDERRSGARGASDRATIDGDGEDMRVIGTVLVGSPAIVPTKELTVEFVTLTRLENLLAIFIETHREPEEATPRGGGGGQGRR